MYYLRCFVLLYFVWGCQTGKTKIIPISKIDSIKNSIIGKWGGLGENEPIWKITSDSIFFYNQKKSYPYEIVNNDLVFDNGMSKSHLKNIKVVQDTLFFEDKASLEYENYIVVKAVRFK